MSYIIRNTIALGVAFLIILGVGGYFSVISLPKKLKALDEKIKANEADVQNTPNLTNTFNVDAAKHAAMVARWLTRSKEIPKSDITGETYDYVIKTIDQGGDVTLQKIEFNETKKLGRYGYNIYSLSGISYFDNIFKFIWLIENGRKLLKIDNVTLSAQQQRDSLGNRVFVKFDMILHAYFSSVPELNSAPEQRALSPTVLALNPFYPNIFDELPDKKKGEIDIRLAVLKGVIAGRAYILDQDKKIKTLEEGDPVYLGSVTSIIPEEGKIECLLNKGGISEKFELFIQPGQVTK